MQVAELEGDHSEAERAELHDGEENAFESIHLGMYWEDHERRIVILDQGRMIACAGLIVADVEVDERTFAVVGFGGVIVTHTRRGEGLARFVMEAAIARAAQLGPDRALLFCRPDRAGLYAKLGFRQGGRAGRGGAARRRAPSDAAGHDVAPAARRRDVAPAR